MREILFRGKRVDNGEWVYGSLLNPYRKKPLIAHYENGQEILGYTVEVIPDAVGQYTGLRDKNGTRIFEGDCFKTYCTGLPVYRHIVRYYPEHFAFMARCIERNTVHYLSDYSPSVIEVIGNIYDNKNLLKNQEVGE